MSQNVVVHDDQIFTIANINWAQGSVFAPQFDDTVMARHWQFINTPYLTATIGSAAKVEYDSNGNVFREDV